MSDISNDLTVMVGELESFVRSALSTRTAESFEMLERQVNRFDSSIREVQQARRATEARAAIGRLEGHEPLTEADRESIRTLVVGDAEAYIKHKNNLNDWLAELERLSTEMQAMAGRGDDEVIEDLRGVVKDAVRLLPNIRSYMEEKERLDHFNAALDKLDNSDRQLLAEVLRGMLAGSTR